MPNPSSQPQCYVLPDLRIHLKQIYFGWLILKKEKAQQNANPIKYIIIIIRLGFTRYGDCLVESARVNLERILLETKPTDFGMIGHQP